MNDRLVSSDVRRARDRLAQLGRWYASRPPETSQEELDDLIVSDRELERVARTARIDLVADVERRAGPFDGRMLSALLDVPRERFVRSIDIAESTIDTPLLLDDEGLATISAPHAYLLSFRVLELKPGDRVAELGTGSGYGAALASRIVGSAGNVFTIEIDSKLAARATRLLRDCTNVKVTAGDAGELVPDWHGFARVTVAFAVDDLPVSWLDAIPEGGRMVAPVGRENAQRLLRIDRMGGELSWSDHGAVRYVRNRGPVDQASAHQGMRGKG